MCIVRRERASKISSLPCAVGAHPLKASHLAALWAEFKSIAMGGDGKGTASAEGQLWTQMRALYRDAHALWQKELAYNSDADPKRRAGLSEVPETVPGLQAWVALQAARYCTAERLKTPAGGPSQTFELLEKFVKAIAGAALPCLHHQAVAESGPPLPRPLL